MSSRRVRVSNRFKKVFGKKPAPMRAAILECIKRVADDPTHPGLKVHKMRGLTEEVWEAYVDQGNRVTFHYADDEIVFRNNCNHDMLDRNP